ncbi:RNA ligase family protein [Thiomonas sp.]
MTAPRIAQPKLLSRTEFREGILARARGQCVFGCGQAATAAHHILERRLWPDGGYYLENGAAVCDAHHIQCEETTISVEDVRLAAGITRPILPPHLYPDQPYDKWGNPVLPDGTRMRGELFDDPSVRKILVQGQVLHLFRQWVKYPRTWHLPWSQSISKDDRILPSLAVFGGRRVVVTRKMDGENTTMYRDYIHARSLDSRGGEDRAWVKRFRTEFAAELPEGWRLCGENLYARHSLPYDDLPTYFMGFSLWDGHNRCLPWDETLEWFQLLGVTPVPVLYDGIFEACKIQALWRESDRDQHEGYVVRVADAFSLAEFPTHVGKFVRQGHVAETQHWRQRRLIPNKLADSSPVSA